MASAELGGYETRAEVSAESSHERSSEALFAAQRYYIHGATMEAIARELGSSRSTVSRLLTYARETGLVEIRLMPGGPTEPRVATTLERTYGIQAHVVPASTSLSTPERLDRTASKASRLLHSFLESDMVVDVSWGTMMDAISRCLVPKAVSNCQFVQLNGFGHPTTEGVHYSNNIMAAFSEAFHASVHQFPVPLFFDDAGTRDALFREKSICRIVELQRNADIVLFNVGTVDDGILNNPYLTGYDVDSRDSNELAEDGAVGEIATTYYRNDGSHEGIRFNVRTSGPDLGEFGRIKHRICATSGNHKVDALHAALLGGYVTDLVIDEVTARILLTKFSGTPTPQNPRQPDKF